MKNFLLYFFLLFSTVVFSQSCTHYIRLTDTFGDGWNGNYVSVSVNGVTVLSNITLPTGYGPSTFSFSATNNATIRVWRSITGSWTSECRTQIFRSNMTAITGTLSIALGSPTSGGTTCLGSCAALPTAPCTNTTAYGSIAAPSTPGIVLINSCTFQSEYNTISSVVSGRQYRSSYSLGGYITVRHTSYNGTVVAHGPSPLTWTAPISGTYYVHYNTNSNCGTASSCGSGYIECLSCTPPPVSGPCTNTVAYGTQFMPVLGGAPFESVYCQYAGEYSTWYNAYANTPYVVTSTVSTDWITIRRGTYNGPVVATGTQIVNFIPPTTGTIFIHVNANSYCATQSSCRNIAVSRISALPVELLYFEGGKNGTSNHLEWATATEHNSSHFIVEKSENGYTWKSIGQVQAAMNSTQEIQYELMDNDVSPIYNYYRLKQFDIDGANKEYGPIVINNKSEIKIIAKRINLIGQEVDENETGIVIEIYEDGTLKRTIK